MCGMQVAVHEEGRAEAGPERDHRLEALALHDGRALDVGVVGDAARLADGLGESGRQVEVRPGRLQLGVGLGARALLEHEVRRAEDVALADHAGEAAGHAVPLGELGHELGQGGDQLVRRHGVGGRHPDPRRHRRAVLVEDVRLEAGAAHVDGDREGVLVRGVLRRSCGGVSHREEP